MSLDNGFIYRVVKRGSVTVDGHTYKADELKALNSKKVIVMFNLRNVMELSILTMDGKFVCKAVRV